MNNKNKRIIIIALFILLIASRVFILLTSDKLVHDEECITGTIASELVNGPGLPIMEYQYGNYVGGELVLGIVLSPIYLVFGENWFTMKMIGIIITLLIALVVYKFLKKYFDEDTAIIGLIVFIFAPPYYLMFNLTSIGNYFLASLFDLLIMASFFNYITNKNVKNLILFGLSCGFALYIHPVAIVMILLCMIFWLFLEKKFFIKKYFLIFIIIFLVGFSPVIYYNLTQNSDGVKKIDSISDFYIDKNTVIEGSKKLFHTVGLSIPKSFNYNKNILSYSYYFIFIIAALFLLEKSGPSLKKNKEQKTISLFIICYVALYLCIFSFLYINVHYQDYTSGEAHNIIAYEHLFQIFNFILLSIAIFLRNIKNHKIIFSGTIILLIIINIIGATGLISTEDINHEELYPTLCYSTLGNSQGQKFGYKPDIQERCNKINDSEYKRGCYTGTGEQTIFYQHNITKAAEYCQAFEKPYSFYCLQGMGATVAAEGSEELNKKCLLIDKDYREYCFRGTSMFLRSASGGNENFVMELCEQYIHKEYLNYCYEGPIFEYIESE